MSRDHRSLRAFELADALVISIYELTRVFPRDEQFGLTSQMRRAAVSVAANIVEGCARSSQKELIHFLNISFGSLREVGYYVHLAQRLGYTSEATATELLARYDETCRVLNGLIRSLQESA